MDQKPIIVWFRKDLRLYDNPALAEASKSPVIPVYLLDDAFERPLGGASRWWLHKSLESLKTSLEGNLYTAKGNPLFLLRELVKETKARAVYWNRCYGPDTIERDTLLKKSLEEEGIEVKTFSASLLCEPWHLSSQKGTPFQVFTPFYRALCQKEIDKPLGVPSLTFYPYHSPSSSLKLEPSWPHRFGDFWEPGETGAQKRFQTFLEEKIHLYSQDRDFLSKEGTSRLSPHLHWGEISPRSIWHSTDEESFLRQLVWREFSYHLLYHFPFLVNKPLRKEFENFPWENDEEPFQKWTKGKTGFPLVDAGMQELWQTGWMHNRVRMLTASFLVKDLLIHWKRGEEWFWDTLLDADSANNCVSWQWVAGCGADAAPYFRVFNPTLQAEKFDAHKIYQKKWSPSVPSLPLVDHSVARDKALAFYKIIAAKEKDI